MRTPKNILLLLVVLSFSSCEKKSITPPAKPTSITNPPRITSDSTNYGSPFFSMNNPYLPNTLEPQATWIINTLHITGSSGNYIGSQEVDLYATVTKIGSYPITNGSYGGRQGVGLTWEYGTGPPPDTGIITITTFDTIQKVVSGHYSFYSDGGTFFIYGSFGNVRW